MGMWHFFLLILLSSGASQPYQPDAALALAAIEADAGNPDSP
jgi:hypothetical protein